MRAIVLGASLLLAVPVSAQVDEEASDAPAESPGTAGADDAAPTAESLSSRPVGELLRDARANYAALEYDRVIPLAQAVLDREGQPHETRLEAFQLLGSALAIVGNTVDAEKPFRLLMRADPDFDMPADTPPKILAVFRKVQVEERAIHDELARRQRENIIATLAIEGDPPESLEGGLPAIFRYLVRDPRGAVDQVRVQYRRQGEPAYSSLALKRSDRGDWTGALPGEYTANDDGVVLEFYVVTLDALGELKTSGASATPFRLEISPGSADRGPPPPLPVWGVAATAAAAVGVAALGGGLHVGAFLVNSDYRGQLEDSAATGTIVDGGDLKQLEEQRDLLLGSALVTYGVAGVVTLGALVMTPFVNWAGEEYPEEF
jgi:hypothetical protein